MRPITVLGASGFLGSQIIQRARKHGWECYAPARGEDLAGKYVGDVVYCIGLTADFRTRPFETVEAHVCKLRTVLSKCEFDSLLYLSSTRIYGTGSGRTEEDASVEVNPLESDYLYNISKLMGESLAICSGRFTRVARLSNVYGNDFDSGNFLATIIRDAVTSKRILLRTSLDSEKDYISIDDAVTLLLKIARSGQERVYNVASGRNVSNRTLIETLKETTHCEAETIENAPTVRYPEIETKRIRDEFGFAPARVIDDMRSLVELYQSRHETNSER